MLEIEKILGEPLPDSANEPGWWRKNEFIGKKGQPAWLKLIVSPTGDIEAVIGDEADWVEARFRVSAMYASNYYLPGRGRVRSWPSEVAGD